MFRPSEFLDRTVDRTRKVAAIPTRLRQMATATAEPTPYRVIYRENKLALRHYESNAETTHDVPVVLTYALVNTPAILDLDEERSVVRAFLDAGFDVYLIDWGEPSRLDASLGLADYVARYIGNCVDAARDHAAAPAVHLVGFSTTSPLCAMYAALVPENVATLSLHGPPLNFDTDEGMLAYKDLLVDAVGVVDAFDNVPAPLTDAGFSLRKPVEFGLMRPLHTWDHFDDPELVARDARILRWVLGGPDFPGRAYREFVRELVVENNFFENRLSLDGQPVDLAELRMPVALLVATGDKYVPAAASRPFLDVIPSEDTTVVEVPTTHVGTFVDDVAYEQAWPALTAWLGDRST
jgi:polyhydroxyalkanoate synthase